jgi:hypothetical protein
MPKGPKGQKRPADVIGNAIKVARIATGEEQEDFGADGAGVTWTWTALDADSKLIVQWFVDPANGSLSRHHCC